jgi:methionyl-tRNA synthetase
MVGPTSPAPAPAPVPPPTPATISIEDFMKVQLKVGKVLECADHTNANKLLVLKVDLGGGEVRQIVSGIKQWYQPAQLVGKHVIVVANLAPKPMRGVESQGMILAASSGSDVIVCIPEKEATPGAQVK